MKHTTSIWRFKGCLKNLSEITKGVYSSTLIVSLLKWWRKDETYENKELNGLKYRTWRLQYNLSSELSAVGTLQELESPSESPKVITHTTMNLWTVNTINETTPCKEEMD